MRKLFLLFCILISMYSCNTKKRETDLEKMGLKGDVIAVFPDTSSFSDPIMEFDNKGNLIRKVDYNEYDNKITLTETSYNRDSSNKVISENEVIYSDDNEFQYYAIRKKYNYQNNQLTTIIYQNKFYDIIEKYKYEEDKLVGIKKEFYAKNKEQNSYIENTNFYYDKNNYLDSSTQIVLNEDGGVNTKFLKTYFKNGLLKSEKSYYKFSDNTTSLSIREFQYNDKNDIIEEKYTDLEKYEITNLIKFNYVYDNKNNWIERTTKYINSKNKDEIVKRMIFYKGQNYSEFIAKYDLFILKYKSSSIELDGNTIQSEQDINSSPIIQSHNDESQVYTNSSQEQQVEKRTCYQCNGTGLCPKCSKPQRVRYKQGEFPNDHNEIRLGMIVCTQCGGNLMNWGSDKNKSCYLCNANGWLLCPECNSNGNGSYIGKCQRCKGSGFDN